MCLSLMGPSRNATDAKDFVQFPRRTRMLLFDRASDVFTLLCSSAYSHAAGVCFVYSEYQWEQRFS